MSYLDRAIEADRDAWDCPLRAELAAAGLSARAFARVLELDVPAKALAQLCGAGDLAATRVGLSRDGSRYEPEGPDPRLLLAVREQGVVTDIVALATHDPDQWALRRGEGWCLGYDAWLACETGRAHELRVHATPLAWLQAGANCAQAAEGGSAIGHIAVLDWDMGLRHLRGLGDHVLLRCNRGAGDRLTALLQHGGIPRVKETGLPPVRRAA